MALLKRFRKEKPHEVSKGEEGIDSINHIANSGPGARRARKVAAKGAERLAEELGLYRTNLDGTRVMKTPEELKLEGLYKKYLEFKKQLEHEDEEPVSKEPTSNAMPLTDEEQFKDFGRQLQSIYTPKRDTVAEKKQEISEQIRRYRNLHNKGYIKDVDFLALPYILEKQKMGIELSESEQTLLESYGSQETRLDASEKRNTAKLIVKPIVMLNAIGLIEKYGDEFPANAFEISWGLSMEYNLFGVNGEIQELFNTLNAEAETPSEVELSNTRPGVRAVLEAFKGQENLKSGIIEAVAKTGSASGITESEVNGSSRGHEQTLERSEPGK